VGVLAHGASNNISEVKLNEICLYRNTGLSYKTIYT
jgi:hypothetical protein